MNPPRARVVLRDRRSRLRYWLLKLLKPFCITVEPVVTEKGVCKREDPCSLQDAYQDELQKLRTASVDPVVKFTEHLPRLPDEAVCKCGHRLNQHVIKPYDLGVMCLKQGCGCFVKYHEMLRSEHPWDPFKDPLLVDLEPSNKYKA